MSLGEVWGSAPQKIEKVCASIGQFVHEQGLGANDCTTAFTVLAVRCARLAGASKEQFLNYAGQMWDEKSEVKQKERGVIIT